MYHNVLETLTLANRINKQRVEERKPKLGFFETQRLDIHEYAKANLALTPEIVKIFNKCLVADEMAILKLQIENGVHKLKRWNPHGEDLESGSDQSGTEHQRCIKYFAFCEPEKGSTKFYQ